MELRPLGGAVRPELRVVRGSSASWDAVCWRRLSAGDVFSVSLFSGRPEGGVDTGHAPRQTAGRHAGHMEVYQIARFKVIYHFLSVFLSAIFPDILLS